MGGDGSGAGSHLGWRSGLAQLRRKRSAPLAIWWIRESGFAGKVIEQAGILSGEVRKEAGANGTPNNADP